MNVQASLNIQNKPFIMSGQAFSVEGTIVRDAGRTAILKKFTVLAKIASSGKYAPFVSLTTTTGASIPCAVYLGEDIPAADLVAGDVTDLPILIGGTAQVDTDQLIFDGGTLSLASVITGAAANPYFVTTAEDCLGMFGIYDANTVNVTAYEN